jgi:nucleotide-binding universal stress UspA family protein
LYRKILVALDGSKLAESVFPHLENLLQGLKEVPEIIVAQAVDPISVPVGREAMQFSTIDQVKEYETHRKKDAEKYLSETASFLAGRGISVKTEVLIGKAGNVLVDYVKKNSIDLVVVATHGRSGIRQVVLGSVAQFLAHSLSVPILMVHPATD